MSKDNHNADSSPSRFYEDRILSFEKTPAGSEPVSFRVQKNYSPSPKGKIMNAILAAIHRQLSGPSSSAISETFN